MYLSATVVIVSLAIAATYAVSVVSSLMTTGEAILSYPTTCWEFRNTAA